MKADSLISLHCIAQIKELALSFQYFQRRLNNTYNFDKVGYDFIYASQNHRVHSIHTANHGYNYNNHWLPIRIYDHTQLSYLRVFLCTLGWVKKKKDLIRFVWEGPQQTRSNHQAGRHRLWTVCGTSMLYLDAQILLLWLFYHHLIWALSSW